MLPKLNKEKILAEYGTHKDIDYELFNILYNDILNKEGMLQLYIKVPLPNVEDINKIKTYCLWRLVIEKVCDCSIHYLTFNRLLTFRLTPDELKSLQILSTICADSLKLEQWGGAKRFAVNFKREY